jgi:hypothetical protein
MIAACNGVLTPEGYTIGKDGNGRHHRWVVNLCGKRIAVKETRAAAVDYCFEHHQKHPRKLVVLADDGVSEDVIARLRSHRAEAQGVAR